jgi:mannose-6-phosphate isomerase-like protein (cupin superfamily)
MHHINEHELAFRNGDSGPKYFFVGPRIDWGVMVLKPGETMGGHFHNEVEETFYFPEGGPVINVNGKDIAVKEGDVFRLDPHDTHDIHNVTQNPVKIIFIKCPSNPKDKVNIAQ